MNEGNDSMSASLNRVQLIGNLGNDPEVRTLQNGGQVVTLSLAIPRLRGNPEKPLAN